MKKKHWVNLLAGLAVFAWLEYRLGARESIQALGGAHTGALLAAAAAFLLAHAVRIVKWRFYGVAADAVLPPATLVRFYFDLKFLGLVTPGRLGEFVPAFLARGGVRGKLFSFTTYDRLTEAFFTILLALLALLFVLRGFADRRLTAGVAILTALLLSAVAASARNEWMMAGARAAGRRMERYHRLAPVGALLRSREQIAGGIRDMQRSLRDLFLPRNLIVVLAFTAAAVAVDLLFWSEVFRAVSVRLPLGALVAAVTLFNMSGFVSPTPGGLGVADALFVLFLRTLGYDGSFGTFVLLLRLLQFALTALPWLICRRGAGPPVPPPPQGNVVGAPPR